MLIWSRFCLYLLFFFLYHICCFRTGKWKCCHFTKFWHYTPLCYSCRLLWWFIPCLFRHPAYICHAVNIDSLSSLHILACVFGFGDFPTSLFRHPCLYLPCCQHWFFVSLQILSCVFSFGDFPTSMWFHGHRQRHASTLEDNMILC